MLRPDFERNSVRVALAVGFCVTLGLWLYTGYDFRNRIETVQRDAASISARYTSAQESLSTVRAHVLLTAVRVRDALLDATPAALADASKQIEESSRLIDTALDAYEPVFAPNPDDDQIARLKDEASQFHAMSVRVIAGASGPGRLPIREVLNQNLMPRREAALAISDEIQRLNRSAFIRQQSDVAELHRIAELQSRDRLGVALVVGLGILLLTSAYAARLESRLRMQLERDARISSELQQTDGEGAERAGRGAPLDRARAARRGRPGAHGGARGARHRATRDRKRGRFRRAARRGADDHRWRAADRPQPDAATPSRRARRPRDCRR